MASIKNYAPIMQEGDVPENQFGSFARTPTPCKQTLEKMNPHPSVTTPRVPCHQYYPSYCKRQKKESCVIPENSKVMVNLTKNGSIEKAVYTKSGHIIRKDYPWSRIPPLQQPLSNNIPDCIPEHVWDPHCRKVYQE